MAKLKVFISYSRRDLEFADQLVAILQLHGFQTTIDREGIHGAEKWEQRLGQLILEADIIVFVLSPDSAKSEVCAWEVDEALRRGKRIIPVLCRPLERQQPHERLRDLNYIFFYADPTMPGSGFGTGQVRLVDALSVDVDWLREHTRLEELAARWQGNDRQPDLLVRGSQLAHYMSWRDRRPMNASEPTDLQRTFLATSEEFEAARNDAERKQLEEMAATQAERTKAIEVAEGAQKRLAFRTLVGMVITTLLLVAAIAAGIYAYDQAHSAETARDDAKHERERAEKAQAVATQQRQAAESAKQRVENLIQRIHVGYSNAPGRRAMEMICLQAIETTSAIATTLDKAVRKQHEERFWELYFGPMNLIELREATVSYTRDGKVENSKIEEAMVRFKDGLSNDSSDLCRLANAVRNRCVSFLEIDAPNSCE